jgi:hypothetical protein
MILFNNPENTKFVISNFSDKLCDFESFEDDVGPIDKVLTFELK